MRKIAAAAILIAIVGGLDGCRNKCEEVTNLVVSQSGHNLEFTWDAVEGATEYNITYDISQNHSDFGSSTLAITADNQYTLDLSAGELVAGTNYDFFVYAVCAKQREGDWDSATNISFDSYCSYPENVSMPSGFPAYLYWDYTDWEGASEVAYYTVEYGPAGFALGNGTSVITSSLSEHEFVMEENKAYDFYVRAYCNATSGWGPWSEALSYFSTQEQFVCTPPTDVLWTVTENWQNEPTGALFEWEGHGNSDFEFVVVLQGDDISTGNIQAVSNGSPAVNLTQDTDYDFYVRTVCLDDSKTDWTGPVAVNIGH